MFEVTQAQLSFWLETLAYPSARILGLASSAPIFSNRSVPIRIRLTIGLALCMTLISTLPPAPQIALTSMQGLMTITQQAIIGIALGFVMRIIFAIVDLAIELVSMQMGLGFASFFDPDSAAQTSVLSEFMGLLASLLFLALNGHLLLVSTIQKSFEWLPISDTPLRGDAWPQLAVLGATLFGSGFLLAMPVICILLIVNIAMGVLTRASPQLNLFAIGFPLTLSAGFISLLILLNHFAPLMQESYEFGFEVMALLSQSLR